MVHRWFIYDQKMAIITAIFCYILFNLYISLIHTWLFIPMSLIIIVSSVYVYRFFSLRKQRKYFAIKNFNELQKLTSREFEEFIEIVLQCRWFSTELGAGTKDGWIDVIASLGEKKFIVQCKKYSETNKIWSPMIQQLNGVILEWVESLWRIFVTTSSFTAEAISEANKSKMELWDKDYLIKLLEEKNYLEDFKDPLSGDWYTKNSPQI